MIKIIQRTETHNQDYEWLNIYSLFSFANYFEADNTCFGIVPTFNEYVVEAGHGFPMHPHQNMELFYIILSGKLEHKDSLGNEQTFETGYVQRISAGSGIARSAYNNGNEALKYITVWMLPVAKNLAPSQEVKYFDKSLYTNTFFPIACNKHSGVMHSNSPLRSNADGTIYRSVFTEKKIYNFKPDNSHQILYAVTGPVSVNGNLIKTGGHARIVCEKNIEIEPEAGSEIIIVDMGEQKIIH